MRRRSSVVRWLIVVGAVLALPAIGYAQEAAVSGTVTDTTGGVLPGVTVTAVHEATGNTFTAVTDERGAYRLALRVGVYRITAELPGSGLTTVTRSGLELLVGQQAVVNLQMAPSAVQESVTVTGEAPLIDTTSSTLGGNVDPRQMSELPVNGRNWVDLTMLAPGSRANAVSEGPEPVRPGIRGVGFQLNIDGQQVTNIVATADFGQPRYSRDAIAEFEFITNRFDATQGRSGGVQVNAITKSGTNTPSGTFSGYFRDDRFNAADFIQRRVIPYSDQQLSATFGGPIRRDRIHFFGNYEYEREPQTFTFSSPYPRFNIDLPGIRQEHKGSVRLDAQFQSQTRLTARWNTWAHHQPFDPRYTGGALIHPAGAIVADRYSDQISAGLTQVLSNRALNEVKVGYAGFFWSQEPMITLADSPIAPKKVGPPIILLLGYTAGSNYGNAPQYISQDNYSLRDDFTYSFSKGGRHAIKLGGEYIYAKTVLYWCNNCMGEIHANAGPRPANLEDLFPVWNDLTTWNLAALSPITARYRVGIGDFSNPAHRHMSAGWVQDDWAITSRLTLNLGLRYDLQVGALGENTGVVIEPFLPPNRPSDTDNIAPRLGFAFSLTDRTVIRGGFGKYFGDVSNVPTHWTVANSHQVFPEVLNDGRPDFAANPFNGPGPATYEEALRFVAARGLRRELRNITNPDLRIPHSYQTSMGVQRQLGDTMSVQADYVYNAGRGELYSRNVNLSYDPVTGVNFPFTDISKRPYPEWGPVVQWSSGSRTTYHGLETAFTKRFSQRWQASGTYTLSGLYDVTSAPPAPFPTAPDLGGEYGLAVADQRHRAVFNGIWDVGYGFQLSGLYFFGSGQRFATVYGGDLRNSGGVGTGTESRLRPNGTIVPRNNFVGKPIHRVDLRAQQRVRLGERVAVDAILELFNLFNHANYGSYTTVEASPLYTRPALNSNVAYQPRMLQLGFRIAF